MLNNFSNQISSILIQFDESNPPVKRAIPQIIFTCVLTMFSKLCYLKFQLSLIYWQNISFDISPRQHISSHLLELYINLNNFNDCLYLVNDRFNELHTLYVNISAIRSCETIDNKVN